MTMITTRPPGVTGESERLVAVTGSLGPGAGTRAPRRGLNLRLMDFVVHHVCGKTFL